MRRLHEAFRVAMKEGKHEPLILISLYISLERIIEQTKADIVIAAVDRVVGSLSLSELEAACPSVGRDWIGVLLGQLKREGRLVNEGRGRGARWRKVE